MKTIAAQDGPLKVCRRAGHCSPSASSGQEQHRCQHGERGHRHGGVALQVRAIQHGAQGADGSCGCHRQLSPPMPGMGRTQLRCQRQGHAGDRDKYTQRERPADALAPQGRRQQQRQQGEQAEDQCRLGCTHVEQAEIEEGDEHTELPYAQRCHGPQVATAHERQAAPGERQQAAKADGVAQHRQRERRHFGHGKSRSHDGGAHQDAGAGGGQEGEVYSETFALRASVFALGAARRLIASAPRSRRPAPARTHGAARS